MPDRMISFKGSMIRAIRAGHKTQTRRVLKLPEGATDVVRYGWDRETGATVEFQNGKVSRLPFWAGDRVAVREAIRAETDGDRSCVRYLADRVLAPIDNTPDAAARWLELFHYRKEPLDRLRGLGHDVPAMHSPLWTSRITLAVEDLSIQRLHEITDEDAIREGVTAQELRNGLHRSPETRWLYGVDCQIAYHHARPRHAFRALWDEINGNTPRRWSGDPLVIVISFRAQECNIADLPWDPRATAARLTPAAAKALHTIDGAGQYSGATFDLLLELGLVNRQYGWTERAEPVRRQLALTGRY